MVKPAVPEVLALIFVEESVKFKLMISPAAFAVADLAAAAKSVVKKNLGFFINKKLGWI